MKIGTWLEIAYIINCTMFGDYESRVYLYEITEDDICIVPEERLIVYNIIALPCYCDISVKTKFKTEL